MGNDKRPNPRRDAGSHQAPEGINHVKHDRPQHSTLLSISTFFDTKDFFVSHPATLHTPCRTESDLSMDRIPSSSFCLEDTAEVGPEPMVNSLPNISTLLVSKFI